MACRPFDGVTQRVTELVERSNDGSISYEEQSEIEEYLQLEHIHHDRGKGAGTPTHSAWQMM